MWLLARNGQAINAEQAYKIEVWPVEFKKLAEYDPELESDSKPIRWGLRMHISFGVMSTENEDQGNLTDWYILDRGYGCESVQDAKDVLTLVMRDLNNPTRLNVATPRKPARAAVGGKALTP